MTVDQDQNVLIAGRNGNNQLLVWKLVEDLTRAEVKNIGPVYSSGTDIDTDLSGNLYVAGRGPSGGTIWKYAPTDGQLLAMQGPFASAGLTSLVVNPDGTVIVVDDAGTVRKLDRDFTELWSTGPGGDFDSKLVLSATGQLFVGGSENSPNVASIAGLSDPRIPPFNFSKPVFHANGSLVALGGYLAPGYSLALEGGARTLSDFGHDADTGRWEMLVDGFPEGESRAVVSVTNLAGFVKQYETLVVVDTVAPRVEIVAPANGSVWSSRPWLSYSVSEGESRVFVNGVDVTKKTGFQLDSLRPGENLIRVQGTDPAGNTGFDEITIQVVGAAVGETPLDVGAVWNISAAGDQTVVDVGEDAQGNIYLFGDTARGLPGYASSSRDLYVAKYDRSGKLLNLWQIGSPAHDYGAALAVTSAGEFIVAYNTRLDPANLSITSMVISRYAASGSLLWSDELSSGAADELHDLAIDAAGNIYVCGDTSGRLNNKKYGGNQDYFLVKYSPQGGRVWTMLSSAPTFDSLKDIEFSHDGYLYGMGRMTDVSAMTLFKFDLNGTLLWKNDYPYPKSLMLGEQMKIGRDGSFYTFIELQNSAISYTYYVTRHDPLGNFINGVYGQAPAIRGRGFSLDAGSNVYVTGYSDDPYGWGWSLDGNRSLGAEDVFIAKYAADDLRALWTRQIGDARGQQGSKLLFSRVNGQAYLAGVAEGEFNGVEGAGLDAFLATLVSLPEFPAPVLTVTEYRSPTRHQAQVVRGYATPGATLAAAVSAPASSPAKVSPPAHHPDGAWSFLVSNLAADTDSVLTISATNVSGSARQVITVTVDTTPPGLNIDPVASPTDLASQAITGHCENEAILTVAGMSGVIPVVNGRWRHEIEHLRGGDNLFTFTATDAAGNQSVRSTTITYVPPPPPTLAVTPAVISTDESADVTLKIGNLSPPGATAIVAQILDLDGNGRADPGEPAVRQFPVTDGVAHGNLNIVSDVDGSADGQITARLNYRFVNDRYHAAGQYVITAETFQGQASEAFAVIMALQPQRLEGRIQGSQGEPVHGALVELHDPWGRSHGFAVTDAAGYYRFNIRQPGDYLPVPLAEGYVFDRGTAPFATVVSGEAATQDLVMLAGGRQVSGRVRDEGSAVGLAGVLVRAESSRYLGAAMTAADGSYHLRLPDGEYGLWVETRPGDGLASRGYVGSRTPLQTVWVDGDLAGRDLSVSRGTDLLCGKVRSAVGVDICGAPVLAVAADGSGKLAEAHSNLQGTYCVALAAGVTWQPGLHDLKAYGIDMIGVSTAPEDPDLVVYPVDARIAGTVRDAAGQPVAGVTVKASHVDGLATAVETARDGRYLLGVSTGSVGDWLVTVFGEQSGYATVLPLALSVTREATVTQDFTLAPLMANTISVIKASYDVRKKVLTVEATSNYEDARLQVDGYGPMTFSRVSKGKYYWAFSKNLAVKPAMVTVSGPEGAVTVTIQ
ncbi:MAG: carboxypeptidase regulatory-like domain-containing protein [Desulfuromonadales bacterium]